MHNAHLPRCENPLVNNVAAIHAGAANKAAAHKAAHSRRCWPAAHHQGAHSCSCCLQWNSKPLVPTGRSNTVHLDFLPPHAAAASDHIPMPIRTRDATWAETIRQSPVLQYCATVRGGRDHGLSRADQPRASPSNIHARPGRCRRTPRLTRFTSHLSLAPIWYHFKSKPRRLCPMTATPMLISGRNFSCSHEAMLENQSIKPSIS